MILKQNRCSRKNHAVSQKRDLSREFERYFFVDFENVRSGGMDDMASLTERDCVKFYYNDAQISLTFALHHQIVSSKAQFEFFEVKVPIKNAVDCQILFHLRDMLQKDLENIKQASFVIVSKDTDYDAAILEHQNRGAKIERRVSMLAVNATVEAPSADTPPCALLSKEQKTPATIRDKVAQIFAEESAEVRQVLTDALLNQPSRNRVNHGLCVQYGTSKTKELFVKLRPLMKEIGMP